MSSKILLIELKNNNIGDRVIADTCEYLIRLTGSSANITRMNLFPPKKIMKKYKNYPFIGYKFLLPIIKRLGICLIKIECLRWQLFIKHNKKAYNYYNDYIKNVDKVVIAGGGLIKYSREDFWNAIHTISEICEKNNVPLYLNAVGIEGIDEENYRCKVLSAALSKDIVSISTRDDLETLKKYLKDKSSKANLVGDPALYSAETYNISANKNSDIIGIGVIRGKIYSDYGFNFSEQDIIDAYVNIIKLLDKNNYKWQMFCNGIKSDYEIGEKVLKKLNLPITEKSLACRPTTPKDLIEIISNYKCIIAARLHANIIATSLGIPSVGLVWNDKLKLFGKLIGYENRFIEKEKFINAEYVLEQLNEAMNNGYNIEKINQYKKIAFENLKTFLEEARNE